MECLNLMNIYIFEALPTAKYMWGKHVGTYKRDCYKRFDMKRFRGGYVIIMFNHSALSDDECAQFNVVA
jgi:hypothetical protein